MKKTTGRGIKKQIKKGIILLSLLLFLVVTIATIPTVQAATIHGSIYDVSLEILPDTIVEVDTNPKQRLVSRNGTYSFTVPPGEFKIKAISTQGTNTLKVEEKITVNEEGDYILDLFLFPTFEDEDELLAGTEIELHDELMSEEDNYFTWIISFLVFIIFIIVLIIFYKIMKKQPGPKKETEKTEPVAVKKQTKNTKKKARKRSKNKKKKKKQEKKEDKEKSQEELIIEENQYGKEIIAFMKKHDGRTTQKELRKHLPLSEAKVSLLIAELEHNKRIKKIKKGRGNILILNK